jgi:hypothetical protein
MSASGELIEKSARPKSTLTEPIPYYPGLKDETGTIIGAILVSYLEKYHPAPQDTSPQRFQRVSSLPIRLSDERIMADLHIARKTLVVILSEIAVWYPSESRRSRAHGASREFIEPRHSRFRKIKLYSAVGIRQHTLPFAFDLRRNILLVDQAMKNALSSFDSTRDSTRDKYDIGRDRAPAPLYPPSKLPTNPRVVELLERASVLAGDRRAVRYTRLRKAIEGGIVPEGVVKRIAGKSVSSRVDRASD